MTESQQKPFHHLRTTFREYVTYWAVAGAIVMTTGFAPDHWVAHVFHEIPSGWRQAFPSGIDYRLVLVFLGVLMIVADVVLRNRRRLAFHVPETSSSDLINAQPAAVDQRAHISIMP